MLDNDSSPEIMLQKLFGIKIFKSGEENSLLLKICKEKQTFDGVVKYRRRK